MSTVATVSVSSAGFAGGLSNGLSTEAKLTTIPGSSGINFGKESDLDPKAFGQWAYNSEKRTAIRANLQKILVALPPTTDLSECDPFVKEASKLVSAITLRAIALGRGLNPPFGNKTELLVRLLADRWVLPSDEELAEAYATAPPASLLSQPSTSARPSRRRVGETDDSKDVDFIEDRELSFDEWFGIPAPEAKAAPPVTTIPAPASLPAHPATIPARPAPTELPFNQATVPNMNGLGGIFSPYLLDPLGMDGVSLGQVLKALTQESQLRATLMEQKLSDKEDSVNFGCLPKMVTKAVSSGHYVSLCHFWDRHVAEKRARSLGSVARQVTREVKDFDWSDFIQAMLRLSMAYSDAGQMNLGRQIVNLLHGAIVLTASWSRQSVMVACDAVRQRSTTTACQWNASSLYQADVHVLLNPLPLKPVFKKRMRRDFGLDKEVEFPKPQSYGREDDNRAKKHRPNVCRFWYKGEKCNFSPSF
jgi:hypothetical protein